MSEEQTVAHAAALAFRLRLFVAGDEPNSAKARSVLGRLCEHYLKGRYEIDVVDVLTDYQAALTDQVMAVPTLFVDAPVGRSVIVGSLSDEEKVLAAFGIPNGKASP